MKTFDRTRAMFGRALRGARGICLAGFVAATLGACADLPQFAPSNAQIDPALLARLNRDSDRMIIVTVANPNESFPMLAGTTGGTYDGASGYTASGSARSTVASIARDYRLREVMAWPIVPLQVHCAVLEVSDGETRTDVLAKLAHDHRVKIAQPLQSFQTLSDRESPPYDENYVNLQRGLQQTGALAAQRISQGEGVRVAVVDTGVDFSHPDLAGRVLLTRDFIERDMNLFKQDLHGTAVAGVIAANRAGGHGILGVAPRASILALKACWQGAPSAGAATGPAVCNSLTLAQALAFAIESHAQVVNLSLFGPPDPLLTQLVDYLLQHGAVVVGAVPPDGDMRAFPVGIARVIAADLPREDPSPDIVHAPGVDVLTLTPGGHYDFMSGSSFSAAYVSGVAALLLAVEPSLDARRLHSALKGGVIDPSAAEMVNACSALAAVTAGGCRTTRTSR
jgi:subtilisin family serine protease